MLYARFILQYTDEKAYSQQRQSHRASQGNDPVCLLVMKLLMHISSASFVVRPESFVLLVTPFKPYSRSCGNTYWVTQFLRTARAERIPVGIKA